MADIAPVRPAATADEVAAGPTLYLESLHYHRLTGSIWPGSDPATLAGAFKRLSRRSLLMAGRGDTVILDAPVDEGYRDLLSACGAGGKTIVAVSGDGASLADDVAADETARSLAAGWEGAIELYLPSPAEERLADAVGRPIASVPWPVADLLNDKVFFQRLLEDVGLASIPFFIGNCDAVAARFRRDPAPTIVRAATSVGGSRVMIARNEGEKRAVTRILDKSGKDDLYLLQPLVTGVASPNVQLYVDEAGATLFACSAQQFDSTGSAHLGNLFDRPAGALWDEVKRQAAVLAGEAGSLGWRGVLGIDFVVGDDGAVHPVEFNARHNTSTHAAWFLNRLVTGDPLRMVPDGIGGVTRIVGAPSGSAAAWLERLGEAAFDPSTKRGILPYDTGGEELTALVAGEDATDRERLIAVARRIATT